LILENGDFLILPGVSPPSYPEEYVLCDTANPAIVQTVTSTTDRVWMDRNLGASRVAQSSDDNLAYGDLYQWGRFADGHQCRNSETTSTLASTSASPGGAWDGKFILEPSFPFDWLDPQDHNLWQGVNGVNNPCPTGFRLPSESEWQAEKDSWSGNNSTGAFASPLKLPVSGSRIGSFGAPSNVGSHGFYWSSSVSGSDARDLYFFSSYADLGSFYRAAGFAVRCIKDY
jgi:uncharacterized protein (TIGR02145 family)